MMGKRSPQDKLFAADHVYLDFVGREPCTGIWCRTGSRCFAMKNLPRCTAQKCRFERTAPIAKLCKRLGRNRLSSFCRFCRFDLEENMPIQKLRLSRLEEATHRDYLA